MQKDGIPSWRLICTRAREAGEQFLAKEIAEKHPVTEDPTNCTKSSGTDVDETTGKRLITEDPTNSSTTNSSKTKTTEAITPCGVATPKSKKSS